MCDRYSACSGVRPVISVRVRHATSNSERVAPRGTGSGRAPRDPGVTVGGPSSVSAQPYARCQITSWFAQLMSLDFAVSCVKGTSDLILAPDCCTVVGSLRDTQSRSCKTSGVTVNISYECVCNSLGLLQPLERPSYRLLYIPPPLSTRSK